MTEPKPRICGHCGQECIPSQVGFASWNGVPICNPESGIGRMECYKLIRDFHHDVPCDVCRKLLKEDGVVGPEGDRHLQRALVPGGTRSGETGPSHQAAVEGEHDYRSPESFPSNQAGEQ